MPNSPVVAVLYIEIRQSGALSVAGNIEDERYALDALQSAMDAVRSHHRHTNRLIIPGKDTGLRQDDKQLLNT